MNDLEKLRQSIRGNLQGTIRDLRERAVDHRESYTDEREAGYTIRNATDDEAVIRIYDEIWMLGVNAEGFVRDLEEVTASKIRVEINSPGGDVWDGIAIYNALRTHPAHITTRVDGIAASIASVIAQAGDHRIMLGASQMMIHNAWGVTIGDSQDHGDMQALLEQQDDIIAGIYANRSGGDKDHFRQLMNAETWLSDARAIEEGLADELVEPERKTQDKTKTLHDQISEAMAVVSDAVASAERVDALRAEAGKSLSAVNVESLDGLRDVLGRLDALLTPDTETSEDITGEYARFIAITQGVGA